jgi:hypothetical protein
MESKQNQNAMYNSYLWYFQVVLQQKLFGSQAGVHVLLVVEQWG